MPTGRQAPDSRQGPLVTATFQPRCRARDWPDGLERRLPVHRVVERRRLGNSDLTITPIGLGTWAIGGGDWVLGWGPQDDGQSIATVRRALECGINWIDTAAVYGLGHAERIIAKALREVSSPDRPYLFTKCGLVWDELGNVSHNLSRQSIRLQAEASLRRLATDYIDMYQIGWPVWPSSVPADTPHSLEAAWEEMATLQLEGKVRFLGISSCGAGELTRLHRIAPVTTVGLPYSLLRHPADDARQPLCTGGDTAIIVCAPLGHGLLAGTMTTERVDALPHNDWRRCHPSFQGIALTRVSSVVERLRVVGDRYAQSPAAVAVAWTLRQPAVTAAIVGARRPRQVDEIVQAISCPLSGDDIAELGKASEEGTLTRRPPTAHHRSGGARR